MQATADLAVPNAREALGASRGGLGAAEQRVKRVRGSGAHRPRRTLPVSSSHVRSIVVSLPVIVVLSACAAFSSKKSEGLNRVDQLLSQVERVQVESEACKERSTAALQALETLVDSDFNGDPVAAYDHVATSIEESKDQEQRLASSVDGMKSRAEELFADWTKSLEAMTNAKLKERSQGRLEATRARYQAVLESVAAAQSSCDAFHTELDDHTLFLEHDLNAESVESIAGDVEDLGERKQELDQRLDHCVAVAKKYVEHAKLHGQTEPAPQRAAENAQRPRREAGSGESAK
jgi:hypothetical protein